MKGRSKPRPAYVKTLDDHEWRNASLMERALHVAASQEGVKEVSTNWSPVIKLYLAVVGLFKPAPWCAAFVTWCLLEAGADRKKLPKFAASTFYWWEWASKNALLLGQPKPRSIFVWNGKDGGHTGFVTGLVQDDPEKFNTLEGNTDVKGSREGTKVMRRVRHRLEMVRYPRHGFFFIPDTFFEASSDAPPGKSRFASPWDF